MLVLQSSIKYKALLKTLIIFMEYIWAGNHKVSVFIIYSLGGVLPFVWRREIKSEPKFSFKFTELSSWSSHSCASFPSRAQPGSQSSSTEWENGRMQRGKLGHFQEYKFCFLDWRIRSRSGNIKGRFWEVSVILFRKKKTAYWIKNTLQNHSMDL